LQRSIAVITGWLRICWLWIAWPLRELREFMREERGHEKVELAGKPGEGGGIGPQVANLPHMAAGERTRVLAGGRRAGRSAMSRSLAAASLMSDAARR